jgi:hypothetical protein
MCAAALSAPLLSAQDYDMLRAMTIITAQTNTAAGQNAPVRHSASQMPALTWVAGEEDGGGGSQGCEACSRQIGAGQGAAGLCACSASLICSVTAA